MRQSLRLCGAVPADSAIGEHLQGPIQLYLVFQTFYRKFSPLCAEYSKDMESFTSLRRLVSSYLRKCKLSPNSTFSAF